MDDLIEFKNSVALHIKQNKIVSELIEKIKSEIPKLEELKLDPELTKYIVTVVENKINKQEAKEIDKYNLCITVLCGLFELNESETNFLYKQIKYLEHNKQIKKISTSKKVKSNVWAWLKKKIL